MIKRVLIMVGIPGSGKSTLAAKLLEAFSAGEGMSVIVSADYYFMNGDEYKFDVTKLKLAHEQCWNNFVSAMHNNYETIIVDNTNVRKEDRGRYAYAAKHNGYQVVEVHVEADVKEAHARCVHGVGESTITRMHMEMHR